MTAPTAPFTDPAIDNLFEPGVRTAFEQGQLPTEELLAIQGVVRQHWRRPPRQGTCWETSMLLAIRMEAVGFVGFDYCQGFLDNLILHAWITTPSGRVVDLVIRLPKGHPFRLRQGVVRHGIWGRWPPHRSYVGVKYTSDHIRQWLALHHAYWGIGGDLQVLIDGGFYAATETNDRAELETRT